MALVLDHLRFPTGNIHMFDIDVPACQLADWPFVVKCLAFECLEERFDAHTPVQLDGRLATAVGDGCNALCRAIGSVLKIVDIEDMTSEKASEIIAKCHMMNHTHP